MGTLPPQGGHVVADALVVEQALDAAKRGNRNLPTLVSRCEEAVREGRWG